METVMMMMIEVANMGKMTQGTTGDAIKGEATQEMTEIEILGAEIEILGEETEMMIDGAEMMIGGANQGVETTLEMNHLVMIDIEIDIDVDVGHVHTPGGEGITALKMHYWPLLGQILMQQNTSRYLTANSLDCSETF